MKFSFINYFKKVTPFFSLLQIISILYWLAMLQNSDSYYIPYLIVGVCGIISCYFNIEKKGVIECRKDYITILAFSILFSMMTIAANYEIFLLLDVPENTGEFFFYLYQGFSVIISFLGGLLAFWNILNCLVYKFQNFYWNKVEYRWESLYVFLLSTFIISIFNIIIMFTCFYPGNITSDSVSVIKQALYGPYSNHHPYYYTKVVEFFLVKGVDIFRDINAAVAMFSIFQIIFMAACISYVMTTLYQMKISFKLILACWGWYILMPFHIMYSFTMWKDVMFGGFVLVFIVAVFRVWKSIGDNNLLNYFMIIVGGSGICLFRSNGWFAFFLTFLCFIFLFGEDVEKKKMRFLILGILLATFILKHPVLHILNVRQPDAVEALSIPIQQISRIIKDCDDVRKENIELLQKIVDVDQISETYRPEISDPIKNLIRETGNQEYLVEHKAVYIKLYLEMSLSHLDKSAEAWIDLTKGYWNGGYARWRWADWVEGKEDLRLERIVYEKSIRRIVDEYFWLFSNNIFLQIFLCIGFHVWGVLVLLILCIVRKEKEALFVLTPVVFIVITLLISTPAYSEFRYVYAVFCCLPFLVFSSFYSFKNECLVSSVDASKRL